MCKHLSHLILSILLCNFIYIPNANAQTIAASSCSQAHVQAAINSASDGDTVTIPSGNCTWSEKVQISNKGITLQGAGQGSTNITCSGGTPCLKIYNASNTRITAFTWKQPNYSSYDGSIYISGTTLDWRVDNVTFSEQVAARYLDIRGNAYRGLIDHCDFTHPFQAIHIRINNYKGSSKGEEYWFEATNWGGPDAIFIEDNTFHMTKSGHNWAMVDCDGPGKYVYRFNTSINGKVINHGYDYNGCLRGSRTMEIYNNTFNTDDGGADNYRAGYVMGGSALLFNNVYSTGFYGHAFGPYVPRLGGNYGCNSTKCDGNQVEDGNSGGGSAPGYPCRDQPGRGQDSGDALGGVFGSYFLENQASEPLYEWNNTWSGGSDVDITIPGTPSGNGYHIVENRDFYNYNPGTFNGKVGVGMGTQAARPATCTTGVAYWDTTNSQLDKCTATNTWTEGWYEPYTYPHPLTGEPPTSGSVPSAPADLKIK